MAAPTDYWPARARAMLEAAGYAFNKDADCWIHKAEGRVISRPTVLAHDEAWLTAWIASGGRSKLN
jgi:hypothetical protein